jgi:hypothetical protein
MTGDELNDLMQTAALITVTGALIYIIWAVGRLIKTSVASLSQSLLAVVRDNEQARRELAALWKRVLELEAGLRDVENKDKNP